jgi:hypothetical protein
MTFSYQQVIVGSVDDVVLVVEIRVAHITLCKRDLHGLGEHYLRVRCVLLVNTTYWLGLDGTKGEREQDPARKRDQQDRLTTVRSVKGIQNTFLQFANERRCAKICKPFSRYVLLILCENLARVLAIRSAGTLKVCKNLQRGARNFARVFEIFPYRSSDMFC